MARLPGRLNLGDRLRECLDRSIILHGRPDRQTNTLATPTPREDTPGRQHSVDPLGIVAGGKPEEVRLGGPDWPPLTGKFSEDPGALSHDLLDPLIERLGTQWRPVGLARSP